MTYTQIYTNSATPVEDDREFLLRNPTAMVQFHEFDKNQIQKAGGVLRSIVIINKSIFDIELRIGNDVNPITIKGGKDFCLNNLTYRTIDMGVPDSAASLSNGQVQVMISTGNLNLVSNSSHKRVYFQNRLQSTGTAGVDAILHTFSSANGANFFIWRAVISRSGVLGSVPIVQWSDGTTTRSMATTGSISTALGDIIDGAGNIVGRDIPVLGAGSFIINWADVNDAIVVTTIIFAYYEISE